ncbi:MAG: hypothetical protein V3T18_01960, partial [Pseudomonadales bacterium]
TGGPLQTSGDHQVNDQVQLIFQLEDELFAQTRTPQEAPPTHLVDRRADRSQEEGTLQANSLKGVAPQPSVNVFQIDRQVR